MGYGRSLELAMTGWPAKQCYKITPNKYENADKSFGAEVALKFRLENLIDPIPFWKTIFFRGGNMQRARDGGGDGRGVEDVDVHRSSPRLANAI